MKLTKEQLTEMEHAAKPLVQWLQNNCHPHCTIIVEQSIVELVEGIGVITFPVKG